MDYAAKFRSWIFFFRFHFCHHLTLWWQDIKASFWIGAISITLLTSQTPLDDSLPPSGEFPPQSRTKPHPEPSTPSPRSAEYKPEPTANGEPDPSETNELSPIGLTMRRISLEPEPHVTSVQVREPATELATGDNSVYSESAEGGFDHCNMADCQLKLDLGLLDVKQDLKDFNTDIYADMPPLLPPLLALNYLPWTVPVPMPWNSPRGRSYFCRAPSVGSHIVMCVWAAHTILEPSTCLYFPPSLPLPPPLHQSLPPLSPGSPSAHPQPTICAVGSPRVVAGGSLVSASSLWVPDSASARLPNCSTMTPSSLLSTMARQSTSSAGLPHPSGSALVCCRSSSTLGLHSSSYTSSLWLCQAPPSLRLHLCRSASVPSAPPDPPHCPGSLSPSRAPLPPAPPPSVGPLESAAIPPPWVAFLAVAWVLPGSRLAPPAPSPSCLLPPSGLPWLLLSPSWLLPPSSPPWILCVFLLPDACPPPKPPPVLFACLPASPLPSPITNPHSLLCPPPKSPSVPPFVVKRRKAALSGRGANCHKVMFLFLLCHY